MRAKPNGEKTSMVRLQNRWPRCVRGPRLPAQALAVAIALGSALRLAAQELPSRLDDATFWKLVADFSEPGGYFR